MTAALPPPAITIQARPRTVIAGTPTMISGGVGRAPAGTVVRLSARPYPYRRTVPVTTSMTGGANRAFVFRVRPDRDIRYTVSASVAGALDAAQAPVTVSGRVVVKLVPLPLGRARVTIVAFHPRDLRWGRARVDWGFASGQHRAFRSTPPTMTHRLSPYVVTLRTTIALPAGPYRFRACFDAPGARALADPGRAPGCSGRGFRGGGSLPAGWGRARFSAADQARFFFKMDSLIPRQFVGYARFLLSTIAGYESWGIPSVARPLGYRVFFKAGWRPTGLGQLVHQIARLEGHHHVFSMAIMTDGDPSMDYGIGTLDAVARALLG